MSGWIGALDRTNELEDGIQRGIAVMARGKLVQEPFVFAERTAGDSKTSVTEGLHFLAQLAALVQRSMI